MFGKNEQKGNTMEPWLEEQARKDLAEMQVRLDAALSEVEQLKSDKDRAERTNKDLQRRIDEKIAYLDGYKDATASFLNAAKGRMLRLSDEPPF